MTTTMTRSKAEEIIVNLATQIIQKKLSQLAYERRLLEVSKKCGVANTRLSEFISGKRSLSMYYISRLLKGGVVSRKDLSELGVGPIEDADQELRRFLKREQIPHHYHW
jgi:transcriptional regulator with XRE-family HTH domain